MNHRLFLLIPLCLLLFGCGSRSAVEELSLDEYASEDPYMSGEQDASDQFSPPESSPAKEDPPVIDDDISLYVFVCGNVRTPGVYELKSGSRIFEALEMAGGMTEDADPSAVNLAEICYDGERIYIPSPEESSASGWSESYSGAGSDSTFADPRIDINTADSAALQQINGIGSRRAEDIIAYRESYGKFTCPEDIMKVPGIKQGMFDKIKDQIKV